MRFRLFQYALPADADLADLNAFVASRRIATVSHHVVSQASGSMLLFVVETAGGDGERKSGAPVAPKPDYREVLTDDQFAVFSKLRTERRRLAEVEGVPVYTIFSNAQLAEMVQRRVTTPVAMGAIDGIGKARVDKYAVKFLPIPTAAFGESADSTDGAGK